MRRRKPGAGGKLYSIRPGALIPHNENASYISKLPILCSRRPPSSSAALEVHLVVLHETPDIPHSMAWHLSLIHSARPSLHRPGFTDFLGVQGTRIAAWAKHSAAASSRFLLHSTR
ncbi:hypothetical protein QN277_022754 [Acacia crassicarpa]|uniref:Uncharacterized protein n=1 Tax=Acacia crassicarpa TaxID=499986 RepID=A0AAE1JFL7_9FABA|nr:hypothetical protein QN277_022754 [Acacia crassicarpa]